MKNRLVLLLLIIFVSCDSSTEKVVVSENIAAAKNTQDNQPTVEVSEELTSLEDLAENEDLLLSSQTCLDDEHPFYNLKSRYQTIFLVYKNKILEYTATPTSISSTTIKKYSLIFVPDGQFFQMKPAAGLFGIVPESGINDLLFLETLQFKKVEESQVIFETSFLSQICELTFTRQVVKYANDSDRDGVANDLDCAPNNADATHIHRGYLDMDDDGYGRGGIIELCGGQYGSRVVLRGGDCNDSNSRINPGAGETYFDGIDNDCDGMGI